MVRLAATAAPVVLFGAAFFALSAAVPVAAADPVAEFETHVRPLLAEHCLDCHNADDQQGGVRLDAARFLFPEDAAARAIVPVQRGNAVASRLMQVIAYADDDIQMPPEGKLSDEAIATLRRWIDSGAAYPAEETVASDDEAWPLREDGSIDFAAAQRKHWAYSPIGDPKPPSAAGARSAIDAFVQARLEAANLTPSPSADDRTLLRRLFHDVTGLRPTHEQFGQYEADPHPAKYERMVDRLLADPHFGVQWGRHWLDVARYADTKGYVGRDRSIEYPYAYTYRDWVVDAMNRDLPYDRFVTYQLAADLVAPDQPKEWAALGLLNVGNRFIFNRHEINNDRIDVVGSGFLGMTLACARCHDHKFDPIPTADYWSLAGVFDSTYEPDELPFVAKAWQPQTPLEQEYAAQRDALQRDVDALASRLVSELRDDLRGRLPTYLLAAAAVETWVPTEGTDEPLHDRVVSRLSRWMKGGRASGIANAIREAAEVRGADDFAAAATERLQTARNIDAHALAVVREKQPGSLRDFIVHLGEEFKRIEAVAEGSRTPEERGFLTAFFAGPQPLAYSHDDLEGVLSQKPRRELAQARTKLDELAIEHPAAPPRAMVLFDEGTPRDSPVFIRGNPARPGDRVPRRTPQILEPGATPYAEGSGRLELARDICGRENPLAARVAVNRIWQHYFGRGLVATPSDFGTRGERPSHPQLLDFLARRLQQDEWSPKAIHRAILVSDVYRQSSAVRADAAMADPENVLLARQTPRRLGFEAMRDTLLQAAGKLDETLGGRPVADDQPRRSAFVKVDRNDIDPTRLTFDFPSPDATLAVRSETIVPQQALYHLNATLPTQLAAAAVADVGNLQDIYHRVLGRDPSREEVQRARAFFEAGGNRRQLAAALLMSNEFHWVD